MFIPNCRRCPLPLNLMSFVLYVSKSYTLCPLAQTQSYFFVKMVMFLAHEGILVILPLQGLLSK
ncbi:hypothetical protein HanRHA438_Chr16g0770881 [Helianthus annuus]|nr:hypothetical protein HanRHA438_Chr16g0770881 [Helianthus annuus]